MTRIKICGLRTTEHALSAVEAGADMLGFILAPSRRQITPEQLAEIATAARQHNNAVELVGVFVNETPEHMLAVARAVGLSALQLSGDESPEMINILQPLPLIKAIRMDGSANEQAWLNSVSERVRLLVDAHVPGSYGGAGVVADWARAAVLAQHRAIVLAGGLAPENVAKAIQAVQPWAVDVSSGVETDGVKDHGKIRSFVAAAQQQYATITKNQR